jgi:hypothetical protein
MRAVARRWRLAALVAALAVAAAAVPTPALASNCSSLSDCFDSILAAVLAAVAVAGLIALAGWALPALALGEGEVLGLIGLGAAAAGVGATHGVAPGNWGVNPGIAQNVAGDPGYLQGLMDSVYPASGGNNCWDIAQAISHSLATGQVQPAAWGSAPITAQGMADATGGDLENSSLSQIDQTMAGAPSGSQGWVVVDDPATGNSHVFNAVNIDGQSYFMDGETHTVAGSAEAIAQATHYTGGGVIVGFIPLF